MRVVTGDIWDYHAKGAWAVIPTNLQYNHKGAVMGAGLAKQAADRFFGLAECYREALIVGHTFFPVTAYRLILLPTKRLWKEPSRLELIESGLRRLAIYCDLHRDPYVAVPKLGCGLGGLDWAVVRPLIEEHLLTPNFALVIPANDTD